MTKATLKHILKKIPQLSDYAFESLEVQTLSGLTNNNYLVITPEQQTILRIPRESTSAFINRENESHNTEIAQQLGIAPKCLWRGEGKLAGASLTEFIDNATKLNSQNQIDEVAKNLITLQRTKKAFRGTLDNKEITNCLNQYFNLCSIQQQLSLKANTQKAYSLLKLPLCNRLNVPSHVDLIRENILQQEDKLWFIDWEYSAMASPFWDIAIFCNSADLSSDLSSDLLKQVLDNYQEADLQCLNHYRFITQVVSDCWQAAFHND